MKSIKKPIDYIIFSDKEILKRIKNSSFKKEILLLKKEMIRRKLNKK